MSSDSRKKFCGRLSKISEKTLSTNGGRAKLTLAYLRPTSTQLFVHRSKLENRSKKDKGQIQCRWP